MTMHQQALLEFLAFWCAMASIFLPLYSMRHKLKREMEWRKVDNLKVRGEEPIR